MNKNCAIGAADLATAVCLLAACSSNATNDDGLSYLFQAYCCLASSSAQRA